MPVFDDPAVLHAIQVEGLEVDRLAFALDVLELAREMAAKVQMNGGAIAGDDHVVDFGGEIRDGGAEIPRRLQRGVSALRGGLRECPGGEGGARAPPRGRVRPRR